MRVIDFLKQAKDRCPTELDQSRMVGRFLKKTDEMHICDLDAALLLLGLAFYFRNVDALTYVIEHKKLIAAISDSSYAKYFAPQLFENDVVGVDDKTRAEEVEKAISQAISNLRLSSDCAKKVYDHELINEIDARFFDGSTSQIINVSDKVKIEVHCNKYYSFGLSQTNYEIISSVMLTNLSDEPIKDAKFVISSDPDYIEFSDINVPLINPHQPLEILDFDVNPHLEKLMDLLEKVTGSVTAKLVVGEEELVSISTPIEYFSYDTWLENALEGSTALFVTPNDIAVQNVVGLVAKEMQKLSGSSALPDYQTGDKNNVILQLKALYNTLHNQAIAYITLPPSYEGVGQKIRLPHDVLVHKQGTCIDLAILFIACAERMGLNPFLIRISGHAFAGVFLEDETFPEMIYENPSRALEMNSEQENEIVFVECTAFTADSPTSFEQAMAKGRDNVLNSVGDPHFAINDIKRSRAYGFLPLPINYNDVDRVVVDYEVVEQNKIRLARKDYSYKGDKLELTEAELNKFDVWEKKLLDLSRRNQLVNYKPMGRGLQLYVYNLNALYNAFERNTGDYRIIPNKGTDRVVFELAPATEEQYKEIESDFKSKNISLIVRSQTQSTSLRFFEKERRKSFEETGSNILYLAIGFIQYFENPRSVNPSYAPIVLVPIDLIRHSKDSYSIRGREEPPFLNISIFEFLHQEFDLDCDDLLTQINFDDENVDIDTVLNTVAERMSQLERASVIRTAAINIFNFSKAVMWSDVKFRREELAKNKVIKSIIDGRYVCESEDQIAESYNDDDSKPEDLAMPLSADSSQIAAIKDCADGKSFILQGPPGTGKSQTITNMIVNAIYHGKTVLFVAEKMAALEVVQKRLNQLCLGKFALEAHSVKADKSSLMSQFEERISLGSVVPSREEHLSTANKLKEERKELNRVINLLHKKNGYFLSFYDSLVNYLDLEKDAPIIEISDEYIKGLELSEFYESARLCEKLYGSILTNGGYRNNPFILYRNSNYVPGVSKRNVLDRTKPYQMAVSDLSSQLKSFNEDNFLSLKSDILRLRKIYCFLHEDKKVGSCISKLIETDMNSYNESVISVLSRGKKYQAAVNSLKERFSDDIFSFDYEADSSLYENLQTANFFKKKFGSKKLLKKIKPISKNPKLYKVKDLPELYSTLRTIHEDESYLCEQMSLYRIVFGDPSSYVLRNFDFSKLEKSYLDTKELVDEYADVFGTKDLLTLTNRSQSFSLKDKDALLKAIEAFDAASKRLEEIGFDFTIADNRGLELNDISSLSDRWTQEIDRLPYWCSLLSTLEEVKAHKLSFIADFIETSDHISHDVEFTYKKSVYAHIINASIKGDEKGSFNSVELGHHIERYEELINKFRDLTIKETAARVSARMPSINDNSPSSSQQGILNKAVKNKCRGKAVRQLFTEVQGILTKIFPVFLMSPISCAQYLSPDMPKFDIVIFDEASQMPTSEAVGAIARGNSLIVVGDSKQMPPTSFFQSKGMGDLDSDLDDQESILDDCDVIGMPSRCLNWHYRSKHESLIRFSNVKFYGNNLVTFPSPNDMVTKVSFVNTKGVYGGSKATNEIEAKAIVKEVERRLKSPELREKSIGIVTFSSVQQDKIDDLLQDMFAKNKDLEQFNLNSKEPIIVKNLENIQGDERDVILFSVCYGPDKNGTMYYRFGPINNAGGEKRLNVAVSRARYEMVVFASFEPERLANMKTASRGAQELYNFLRYAKDGASTLVIPNGSAIEARTGIEKSIARKLEEKGYKTETNVGKSSFRVDVGIVNPDNENEYILGVLCDSYSYESASTSRDRNIVQPTALDMLGWNLMRVWSFDYMDDPDAVVRAIVSKIEDIRSHPENYKHVDKESSQLEIKFESKEVERVDYSEEYKVYPKVQIIFEDERNADRIKENIVREILEMEAPISLDVLRNRFANAMGFARAGAAIQNDMFRCLDVLHAKKNTNNYASKTFFWRPDQVLNGKLIELKHYRVGGDKPRSMDNVPKEEIIMAIREVLTNDGPIFESELIRCVAECFGIRSIGRVVDESIHYCIDFYKGKGELVMIDNGTRVALKRQAK